MDNFEHFRRDPRDYALYLVEQGEVSTFALLMACLKYMSHNDIQRMLIDNEMSPRFMTPED